MNIRIRNRIKQLLVIISLIILVFLVIGLMNNKLSFIDDNVYDFIIKYKSSFLTTFFKLITFFASVEWLIIVIILGFIFIKDRSLNITLIIYLIGVILITLLLKNTFLRDRPFDLMIIEESGYSFPSGHSSVSMAFYGFISYLIYKNDLSIRKKIIFISFLLILIFLIGVSRIYLGVHYPSDVLAGFLIGIIYLVSFTWIYKLKFNGRF